MATPSVGARSFAAGPEPRVRAERLPHFGVMSAAKAPARNSADASAKAGPAASKAVHAAPRIAQYVRGGRQLPYSD